MINVTWQIWILFFCFIFLGSWRRSTSLITKYSEPEQASGRKLGVSPLSSVLSCTFCLKKSIYKTIIYFCYHFMLSIIFYWGIVDLQCCVNFCCAAKWFSYTYIHSFFSGLFHYGLSQDIEHSSLCCTVEPCCSSILYTIVCICRPQTPNPCCCKWHYFILFMAARSSIL